jgi:hypothetical protein
VKPTRASSLSLVRFDKNDYSVPVSHAHHEVVAKGDCERVAIWRDGQRIASHQRIWDKEQVCFDPVHYLALLERKPGAFDHARPLEGWKLPEPLLLLRRRLEADHGGAGTKEFIGVLRLLERWPMRRLTQAVEAAIELGCARRELIEQHLYGEERQDATFRLDGREHLKVVEVACTDPADYGELLGVIDGEEVTA